MEIQTDRDRDIEREDNTQLQKGEGREIKYRGNDTERKDGKE